MYQQLFAKTGFSMERLASFCAVADAGSIVAAAKDDTVRQSLMSRQIRELESFFGVELVRRRGRGLELTEAGRELAAVGRENLKGLADFAARCQGEPWRARLVASNSVAHWLVLPRLQRLRRELAGVQVEIHHEQARDMVRGLREGAYDIAFARADLLGAGLRHAMLGEVGHSLLIPKSLVRQAPKTLADAFRAPLALPVGGQMRELTEALAAKAGTPLRVMAHCSSYLQAAQLLAGGLCAAVLPDLALAGPEAGRCHRFALPHRYRLCLAWSARNADANTALASWIGKLAAATRLEPVAP